MPEQKDSREQEHLIRLGKKDTDVAITIIDPQGILLYYNKEAARTLDRKPEYIGKDVHSHHKKVDSNRKLMFMLQEFKHGRKEPFRYQAKPYGEPIEVTLSPILEKGKFIGCTQSVVLKNDIDSEKQA
ncbi:MAG: PAS domain-containing protein [Deltaproteobacteria bacterium]|nr:PAS domain-containing protein [Deltaproteobacteria bacterium]